MSKPFRLRKDRQKAEKWMLRQCESTHQQAGHSKSPSKSIQLIRPSSCLSSRCQSSSVQLGCRLTMLSVSAKTSVVERERAKDVMRRGVKP
jgi:hypothetical protein